MACDAEELIFEAENRARNHALAAEARVEVDDSTERAGFGRHADQEVAGIGLHDGAELESRFATVGPRALSGIQVEGDDPIPRGGAPGTPEARHDQLAVLDPAGVDALNARRGQAERDRGHVRASEQVEHERGARAGRWQEYTSSFADGRTADEVGIERVAPELDAARGFERNQEEAPVRAHRHDDHASVGRQSLDALIEPVDAPVPSCRTVSALECQYAVGRGRDHASCREDRVLALAVAAHGWQVGRPQEVFGARRR